MPQLVLAKDNLRINLDNVPVQYYASDNRELSFIQVKRLAPEQWLSAEQFTPYGLIERHYWLKLSVELPPHSQSQPLYLEIDNPLVDRLDIYIVKEDSVKSYIAGDSVATNLRPIATPTMFFPLPKTQGSSIEVYIKYQDEAASVIPLAITNSTESFESVHNHGVFTGIICGVILIMILATISLHYREKQPVYLYFLGFMLFGGLSILSLEGIGSIFLWGNLPWIQNLIMPPLFLLTAWCAIKLTKYLASVALAEYSNYNKTFKWLAHSILICSAILFALPTFIAVIISVVLLIAVLLLMLSLLAILHRKTKDIHPLLLGAWFAFIVSLLLKASYYSGLISMPTIVISLASGVYSLQFILWGALVLRALIQQKEQAYDKQAFALEECQEQLEQARYELEQHEEDQQTMEAIVDERTFELNVTLRELQETNRQLEEQATNDALTGVKNRKFFDQRLLAEYRLSRRQQTPLSLLLLDADKFKLVNDTHGHLAGDQVLIKIAQIASRILKRPNDYVCRYGGEEFAILLSNTDQTGACKVAEVIRQKIADTVIKTEAIDLQVTVSIGVSTLFIDAQTGDSQLFEQADQALYHAKESGRNNIKTFQEFQDSVNQ
ncbi:diguanylate cyclase [Psychrobium sp. MM17-31]|uniref:sensor domain-containing diguanylate cyclase n=1 Tax=Psychrobium sp. MM17-31 TaxID=2917758 RepID=UPI001EF5E56D|nr:diguanylate cyclase [Psychrobium sp. MM17-31]MCG7532259.1 diguanylate cyclase [Psychrobium sp. MM17-31]